MPAETLSIRNRSAIGRFPAGTLPLEDPEKVKPKKPETKWSCGTWFRQCCVRCCCRKTTEPGVTETEIPETGNLTAQAMHWQRVFQAKNKAWTNIKMIVQLIMNIQWSFSCVTFYLLWNTKGNIFKNVPQKTVKWCQNFHFWINIQALSLSFRYLTRSAFCRPSQIQQRTEPTGASHRSLPQRKPRYPQRPDLSDVDWALATFQLQDR